MTLRTRTCLALIAGLIGCAALAQDYPARNISLIVPYGAGGGTDVLARAFAAELSARMKQSVTVENVPGAGGTIGVQKAMNAAPDGYTLVLGNGVEFEMLQLADPDSARGKTTNLTPVALIATQPMVLVARATLGPRNADELVAAAKARPGSLTLASAGPGTSLHLAGEMIKKSAGIQLVDVPYKSGPQLTTDLIAGNVDAAVLAIPTAMPHLQSGKLAALAVTDSTRSPALPAVPSLSETRTIKGVEATLWYAVFAPPQLPPAIGRVLERHAAAILADPAFQQKLVGFAMTPPKDSGARELDALKSSQLANFRKALAAAPAR